MVMRIFKTLVIKEAMLNTIWSGVIENCIEDNLNTLRNEYGELSIISVFMNNGDVIIVYECQD
jgi:hypothetical protein